MGKGTFSRTAKGNKTKFDIIETLKKGIQLTELAERLNISPKTCEGVIEDIKGQGYNVLQLGNEIKISNIVIPSDNRITNEWKGEKNHPICFNG